MDGLVLTFTLTLTSFIVTLILSVTEATEISIKNCHTGEWSTWLHFDSYIVENLANLESEVTNPEAVEDRDECAAQCSSLAECFGAVVDQDNMCRLLKLLPRGSTYDHLQLQPLGGNTVTLKKAKECGATMTFGSCYQFQLPYSGAGGGGNTNG